MEKKMQAAVLHAENDLRYEEVDRPDPSLIIDKETELSEINNMLSKLDNDKSIVRRK